LLQMESFMSKEITVEDILDLYDPCRDKFEYISTSMDVSALTLYLGWQLQATEFVKMPVDSFGIVNGKLAIWPTDKALKEYLERKSK